MAVNGDGMIMTMDHTYPHRTLLPFAPHIPHRPSRERESARVGDKVCMHPRADTPGRRLLVRGIRAWSEWAAVGSQTYSPSRYLCGGTYSRGICGTLPSRTWCGEDDNKRDESHGV